MLLNNSSSEEIIEPFNSGKRKKYHRSFPTTGEGKPITSCMFKPESTRLYPNFNVGKEPLMVSFLENLTNCDGGKKSAKQARQIAVDVSKHLVVSNKRCL